MTSLLCIYLVDLCIATLEECPQIHHCAIKALGSLATFHKNTVVVSPSRPASQVAMEAELVAVTRQLSLLKDGYSKARDNLRAEQMVRFKNGLGGHGKVSKWQTKCASGPYHFPTSIYLSADIKLPSRLNAPRPSLVVRQSDRGLATSFRSNLVNQPKPLFHLSGAPSLNKALETARTANRRLREEVTASTEELAAIKTQQGEDARRHSQSLVAAKTALDEVRRVSRDNHLELRSYSQPIAIMAPAHKPRATANRKCGRLSVGIFTFCRHIYFLSQHFKRRLVVRFAVTFPG